MGMVMAGVIVTDDYPASHIHHHVAYVFLATIGRGREFEDETRVVARNRLQSP